MAVQRPLTTLPDLRRPNRPIQSLFTVQLASPSTRLSNGLQQPARPATKVYFGTDSTPDGGELIGDQAETTFDPELEYDTIYFWRIDSKNEVGTITGDVWKFRTRATPVPKPAKATSPRPAHETTDVSRRPILEWSAAPRATSYVVYLGTDSTLGRNERQGDEQTGITFEPDTALEYATTYYWRVDSKNDDGTTTGDVWSFITEVKPAQKAANHQPDDGATNVDILADLTWSEATGSDELRRVLRYQPIA